ncbi:MAG TPA: cytochrome c oxidase subunit II [Longimicrobiales bacterium]
MSVFRAAARHSCARRLQRRLVPSLALVMLTLALAGCEAGGSYPQTTFRPVSRFGEALNDVFYNTFGWTMGIMVIVIILILFAAFRFRERPDSPQPEQIHGNTKLEIAWTIVPAIIVVFMGVPTVRTIFDTQREPPEDALRIEVIGHQWWWEFRYPEYGIVTANEMWVPVDRPVSLAMRSADVIHSFWIPRIGGKRDVNPLPRRREGEPPKHDNYLLFTVDEPGQYLGQCAEYCGEAHAIMRMTVMAAEPQQFDGWIRQMRTGGPQTTGLPPAQDPSAGALVVSGQQVPAPQSGARVVPVVAPPQVTGVAPAPPQQPRFGQLPAPTGAGNPYRAPVPESLMQEEGRRIFLSSSCVACHAVAGTPAAGPVGPNLTMIGSRPWIGAGASDMSHENLVAWIKDPQAVKPGALMPGTARGGGGMAPTGLTEEEVRAVAAYLLSLK